MVCIPVDYTNARAVCNNIENGEYKSMVELRSQLDKDLGVDYEDEETDKPVFFSLTDYMEEANDQYLNHENYFISYVKIIKK
jgi:hypothetical protein